MNAERETRSAEQFEAEVRRLRDNIYGPGTDNGWEACKENWLTPKNVAWLRRQRQNQGVVHSALRVPIPALPS